MKLQTTLRKINLVWTQGGVKGLVRKIVVRLPAPIARVAFYGKRRFCPVCESYVRSFWPFRVTAGDKPRPDAWCPVCGSLERHRLLWSFIQRQTDLLEGHHTALLHIAPEKQLEEKLRHTRNLDYLSGDLHSHAAMVQMDIENIQYPDNSFDVIVCSHVLEHVPSDMQAMREFHRTLKEAGYALIMVPITADNTFEDPSVKNTAERRRLYGQDDHVRRYGPDIKDRLEGAGFQVKAFSATEIVGEHNIQLLGVRDRSHGKSVDSDQVFVCKK